MRYNRLHIIYICLALFCILLTACKRDAVLKTATAQNKQLLIYPDYTFTTIPPNIAPLNFTIKEEAEAYFAQIKGDKQEIIVAGDNKGTIQIPIKEWKALLQSNKGKTITYTLYTRKGDTWFRWKPFTNRIAKEEIDPYLTYRLIEPSYELYWLLGIYQRNLESFEEKIVYENDRQNDSKTVHCINCHSFQAWKTDRMLFHVRETFKGTIFTDGKNVKKVDTKTDSTITAGVYPAWHPKQNKVAFSVNNTTQSFHTLSTQKIEVLDENSDLILYDVSKDEISTILNDKDIFETYPAWNPAGDTLYYCACRPEITIIHNDSAKDKRVIMHYDSLYYDIFSIPYDVKTNLFGKTDTVFAASRMNKSATLPRISPDGRYLLFTLGNYGQFHIWHKSSDLYVIDLQKHLIRPLSMANSKDAESYHSWSSNGRWIVFSSRRDDGSYTRPYFTYFDANGGDSKPFLLPQEDPEYNIRLLKSYNVPELTKEAVQISPEKFKEVIFQENTKKATYISR